MNRWRETNGTRARTRRRSANGREYSGFLRNNKEWQPCTSSFAALLHHHSHQQMECVMRQKIPPPAGNGGVSHQGVLDAKRSREAERMLTAIAHDIVAGRLPPDDAFAWARIAAYEVKALGG